MRMRSLLVCVMLISTLSMANWITTAARPLPQDSLEGDLWLQWNQETREVYYAAYIRGLSRGFYEACTAVSPRSRVIQLNRPQKKDALDTCLKKSPRFTKEDPRYYLETITALYRDHPEIRRVSIGRLILFMSDSNKLTPEQIRDKFRPSQPH